MRATRREPRLEGEDWEEIFARSIGANWTPSNVGLDDIQYGNMAWGAKTVKNQNPFDVRHLRLISGRNSPTFSFHTRSILNTPPDELGEMVLEIWNARVDDVRSRFATLRTVVLVKSDNLLETSVFEINTIRYTIDDYYWQWNERKNLEGYEKSTNIHRFTWQPHGSQFTIIEDVPDHLLKIRIKRPPLVKTSSVLEGIGYDDSWVEILS